MNWPGTYWIEGLKQARDGSSLAVSILSTHQPGHGADGRT